MSVLSSIFGGAALAITSRILMFGLSKATMAGMGAWFAMKAPLPEGPAPGGVAAPYRCVNWVRA